MALDLTAADAALKEDYQPSIREQLNQEIMMVAQMESRSTDVEGRRAVLSLHTSRNSGVGSRAEGGTLPTAGSQGYTEERVSLKYHYGRIQINGPVIRAMKSDTGSFTRAVDSESQGIVRDLKREYNRQIFNDADGTIARCVSVSTDTITLNSDTPSSALRQLEVGSLIDVGTVTSPTDHGSALEVSSVNTSTPSVTFTTNPTAGVGTGDYLFRAGAASTTSGATNELTGLQAIVRASGTLFNVDPTTVTNWVSTVDSNSGTDRAATDNLFESVIDEIWLQSGEAPTFIVTSPGVRRNYAAQLKAQKRFSNTIDLKGGFKALTVAAGNTELPLAVDRDCPDTKAFLLNMNNLVRHTSSDWEFMDEDGSVLSRVSGVDAYEATLFNYSEITTDRRNTHGLIEDLLES